ncbi:MAG: hypothetical protein FJ214_07025 [Ignavibacteria bacterium]|nr:hypothetical protein [Ignavibacteria bacterium]
MNKLKFSLAFFVLSILTFAQSEENQLCFDCHSDNTLTVERNGKKISLFVNEKPFNNSVHSKIKCIDCHADINPDDIPHPEILKKVNCAKCHETAVMHYDRSLHGDAHRKGKFLAPSCESCHGKHDILASKNSRSKTYVMNIPTLCGKCHKEGTPVSKLVSVREHQALDDYSESIHGEGLFKRGLIVTAVCTSCHTSHDILPHENPLSSINKNNIATTCTQCHRKIEEVHTKVISGRLWEKEPHKVPNCIDCHQPHKIRRVFYTESYPDDLCMKCHSQENLYKIVDGKKKSLFVNYDQFKTSVHTDNACFKCHTNVNFSKKPVCLNSGKVDCSMCHSAATEDYQISIHGTEHNKGNEHAPYCTDCHETHNMKSKVQKNSPTFARNVPELCAKCHRTGMNIAASIDASKKGIVSEYVESIHGKGLLQSGLMVTATCVDCHSSHRELPRKDPRSTVFSANIATTCAQCHLGIYEEFRNSIHSPEISDTDKKLPVCNDCHFSHEIGRTDQGDFRKQILNQCGNCHEEVTTTYFDTFHGKVSKLGAQGAAKCSDCHGSHMILPTSNPESKLSRANIVETCKSCHPNSNKKFVGYLTHATHHNREKYPYLFYTFWFMTILLSVTFLFFGTHTLLWLPRALREKRLKKQKHSK